MALGSPTELDVKSLLLKTPHTLSYSTRGNQSDTDTEASFLLTIQVLKSSVYITVGEKLFSNLIHLEC